MKNIKYTFAEHSEKTILAVCIVRGSIRQSGIGIPDPVCAV